MATSLDVTIRGGQSLRALAAQFRTAGRADLSKEMGAALTRVAGPVEAAIALEADKVMPSSGGYRAVLARSLQFRIDRRAGGNEALLRLKTFAEGAKQRRDIVALNLGTLRHPVYGRSRKTRRGRRPNPWAVTRIRAGFFDRGVADAADRAQQELGDVVTDFAQRLIQ